MPVLHELESLLQTYTFDELLEYNDVTQEEVLLFLVDEDFIKLPEVTPLDFDDE